MILTETKAELLTVLVKRVRVAEGCIAVISDGKETYTAQAGVLVTVPAEMYVISGPEAEVRADPTVAALLVAQEAKDAAEIQPDYEQGTWPSGTDPAPVVDPIPMDPTPVKVLSAKEG